MKFGAKSKTSVIPYEQLPFDDPISKCENLLLNAICCGIPSRLWGARFSHFRYEWE
jgi:hypothetical protein